MARLIDVPVSENLLGRVAADFGGEGLSPCPNVLFVFNNNRAVHVFGREWSKVSGAPSFAPRTCTLEGLPAMTSTVTGAGSLAEPDEVLLLHRALCGMRHPPIPPRMKDLSAFYAWGAEWVKAFSEMDAAMVSDAQLAGIGDVDELSGAAEETRAFYRALPEIRQAFSDAVRGAGRLTRGDLYELARRNILSGDWPAPERTVFVGLFALTRAEMDLVKLLSSKTEATFYRHHDGGEWSPFRMLEHTLGATVGDVEKANLPEVTMHALPSVQGEVLRAGELLRRWEQDAAGSAVVLLKPAPLVPFLWEVVTTLDAEVNITMGYPLSRTPLFSLLNSVLDVCDGKRGEKFSGADYLALLAHPYVKNMALQVEDGLEEVETGHVRILVHSVEDAIKGRNWTSFDLRVIEGQEDIYSRARDLTKGKLQDNRGRSLLRALNDLLVRGPEAASSIGALSRCLGAVIKSVARHSPASMHGLFGPFHECATGLLGGLEELLAAGEEMADRTTVRKIVRAQLSGATVPFKGLPMRGIQVLGLLETRALNFEKVIVLDCNSDALPPVKEADPVLPPSVRRRLGLAGYAERVEVSRHNFKRLLYSSGEVHLLYVAGDDSPRSPLLEEVVFQLQEERCLVEEPPPRRMAFRIGPCVEEETSVNKGDALLERLAQLSYSPTDLDAYLDCPLKFYFQKVCRLSEPRELSEEIDARTVGSLLHGILCSLFRPHIGRTLDGWAFSRMIASLPEELDRAFPRSGEASLVKDLANQRLSAFLAREEKELAGKAELIGVESRIEACVEICGREVKIYGKLDRVDRIAEKIVVTDYKTGKGPDTKGNNELDGWKTPPGRGDIRERISSFQLPVYVELAKAELGCRYGDMNARFVNLKDPNVEPAELFEEQALAETWMENVFRPALAAVVSEINDPGIPFAPLPLGKACNYCPFVTPCGYNFSRGGVVVDEE